jgi:hypothetical protein
MTRFSIPPMAVWALACLVAAASAAGPDPVTQPVSREKSREFAMVHQGDAEAGKELFLDEPNSPAPGAIRPTGRGAKPARMKRYASASLQY